MEIRLPGISLVLVARNRKLAPVQASTIRGYMRFKALGPYCACTYVTIQGSCRDSCRFKNGHGCYAEAGYMGPFVRSLDEEAKGLVPSQIARNEAKALDAVTVIPRDGGKYGKSGRDLRLHVSGDTYDEEGVRALAEAAARWIERGGGSVWTYTHSWREVPAEAWKPISVLASCETPSDVKEARERGYAPALVVRDFRGARRAHAVPEIDGKVLPCPAETSDTTCVQCRLCFDTEKLRERNLVIGFSVHGRDSEKAKRKLPILDSLFGNLA